MFYTNVVHIANDCGYKILRYWANPQKCQTLAPAKIVTLRQVRVFSSLLIPHNCSIERSLLWAKDYQSINVFGSFVSPHQTTKSTDGL